jgi:hypothetical protein
MYLLARAYFWLRYLGVFDSREVRVTREVAGEFPVRVAVVA